MAALGSLVVSLALEYANFTGGLDKSEQAALAAAKRVQDTMDGIKQKAAHMAGAVAGSLVAAFTVGAFKNFIGEAINAADEMSKMAQKTGMAVEQVAGVQLAFRQAGNSAESMQTSIAKLSKNMADGNQAFAAMGINVKGTDGHLKTTRQTLGEVADKFASYADGAEKTALAQELFGKSGADLIPLLNAGGAALDEYDAMAKKLGLTLDEKTAKSAEDFNDTLDLMGQGVAGIGTQIAAQLLPTLSGLAGEFLETMTSGDKLKNTADFLAGAMKGLYVVGLGVVELFKTVGGVLGGVAAATVAALSGDFRGAANILGEMRTDIGTSWKTTLAQMQAAWNTTGSAAVSAMVATQQAAKGAAPVVQKLGAAAKEAADEFAKLRDKITGKETGTDSDFIKNLFILKTAYDTRRISLQEYMDLSDKYVRSQKYMQDAEKASMQIAQAHADLRQKEADSIATWFSAQEQAAAQALASAKDRVVALQAEEEAVATARDLNISLGEAIEQVTIARLKEKLDTFREGSDGAEAIKREIAAREELVGLLGRKDVRESEQQGWSDMWSSVDRSAHDVFVNVLDGGQDAFKRLGNTLKTSVLDVLYQMTVRKWIISIGTSIFGAGFGVAANAATGGGGGILGMAANGASLYNGLSSGTGMLGTVGNWLGLGATGGAVGAGAWGSAAVAGSYAAPGIGAVGSLGGAAGASSGIMGALGAIPGWGWALAGLALLPSLFGHTLKDSGIQGTFGGTSGFEGSSYKFYEGGLFSSDKTDIGALDETVRKTLGDTFNAMKTQVTDFATALGLSTDKLKGFTSDVKISLKGLSDTDAQKKLQEALATANNDLAQQVIGTWVTTTQDVVRQVQATAAEMEAGSSSTNSVTSSETTSVYKPSEFAHEGEKAIDTLKRLATSLELANTWLTRFGASLFDKSLAGGSQASDFIDKTGGQDAFNSQASSYFNNYYTSAQKYQAAQDEIAKKLNDAGIAMPHTAAEFKAAMDQFLAMGVAGQDGAAALLAVNDAFAQIHGTIGQLEQAMGVSADSLKGILDDVRKNATSAADAKKMASQKFEDSIYTGLGNAMTQGLSQMIMNAVVGPLVNGLLAGATGSAAALTAGGVAGGTSSAAGGAAAGGAVASGGAAAGAAMAQGGAMAGAAVASTIDQARTYMAGFAAIMADPTVRDTISQIAAGFGDIAASMPGLTGGASSASSAMSSAGSSAGSMGDAVSQLGDTLDAEVKRLRGMMVEDSPSKGRDFLLADFTTTTAAARAGDQTALARLPELSQQLEAATKLTAGSSVELARMRGWLAGSLVETQSKFAAQTDAQFRAQMAAMNPPGYDLRDTPRYADTWSATPIYTPWEEPTADSRYADSWSTTPLPGTGNLRGQDPNMAPDWRYTGGGIGAGMYDARSPDYRPDWRYNDSWSADPHLINPRPSWYGPSYEIGTNYVPKTGLAMLHEGEEVTPKAWNPAAGGRDGWREVVSELQAMRRDIQTLQQPDQQAHQKDVKRLGERLLRVVERMDGAGIAVRAEGALV